MNRRINRRAKTTPGVVRDNSIFGIRVTRDGFGVATLAMHYRRRFSDRVYTGPCER